VSDPVRTLFTQIDEELAELARAASPRRRAVKALRPSAKGPRAAHTRLAEHLGRRLPLGVATFFSSYDGGQLFGRAHVPVDGALRADDAVRGVAVASDDDLPPVRFLSFDESEALCRQGAGSLSGLWPFLQRGGQLIALDLEGDRSGAPEGPMPAADPGDEVPEWAVVSVADRSVDRLGTSLLRYLHVLAAELRFELDHTGGREASLQEKLALATERCRRDPHLSEHWVDWSDLLAHAGREEEADEVLDRGLLSADPVGPSLLATLGLRALLRQEQPGARANLDDALSLPALTARDDDARLDAAAMLLSIGLETGDVALTERARGALKNAAAATGAFWRGEALRAAGTGDDRRAALALRLVETLIPDDKDVERLRVTGAGRRAALAACLRAREKLDDGLFQDAVSEAQKALGTLGDLGMLHGLLAEAHNGMRAAAAIDEARRAVELNPALVDAWRELGDAQLDRRQYVEAIAAYDEGLRRDPSYGLLHAKRAQALLELGRRIEALDAITAAGDLGGDAFFLAAVKGDILSAMGRHREAAEAYDQALIYEPDDHWALHQAAIEHGQSDNLERSAELFELAIVNDRDGCHQTLVDYAQLLQKMGRIGDAVRLFRKAVAAVPHEQEWRQWLKDAEKELRAAPN
jgi:tetratricopeptide (TPR) repeat protein